MGGAMLWINREFLMLHGSNAVTLPIATAIFVVTINFVRGLLIAARFLTALCIARLAGGARKRGTS